jgi:hypothetical protein
LFRNNRNSSWTDVTAPAGVAGSGYAMGAAAADYDNDGWTDLFVTGVRSQTLYRNTGDGRFEDVTAVAGVAGDGAWSVSALWFDYDGDDFLDLFVVRYVVWNPAVEPFCGGSTPGARTYCHPRLYEPLANTLYRNLGNGRFRDVSAQTRIAEFRGKGMGACLVDADSDGRLDVFVANDAIPNFLFRNTGNGRFEEVAVRAGVALNDDGRALSFMGADCRDFDNDGREDIFVTALSNETFPLFRNAGGMLFQDVTAPTRLASLSLPYSGWGAAIADLDNDGAKDLLAANGHVMDNAELTSSRASRQPNAVFRNRGGSFSLDLLPGNAFHRGLAIADFDRDGRLDAVVTRLNEKPLVLRNLTRGTASWIGVRPRGRESKPAVGAVVRVETAGGAQWNRLTPNFGYASSSEPVVHFGLGDQLLRSASIIWPSGCKQEIPAKDINRYVDVHEEWCR